MDTSTTGGMGQRRPWDPTTDEEAAGFIPTSSSTSQGVERQLRTVRLMSMASVFLGVVSVVIMATVIMSPTGVPRAIPSGDVIGLSSAPETQGAMKGWYRCYLDSLVREGEDTESAKIRTLYAGSLVYISEAKGRRVRILRPMAGWMSMITEDGVEILRPDQTYEAGPDKADIEAVFRSRRVREANKRLQESAVKLTKVEQQLVDTLKKMKDMPQHVQQKFQEKWPQIVQQAPKTGEHLAKHTVKAVHKIVKPQGVEHLAKRVGAAHGQKLEELVKTAKHEVDDFKHMRHEADHFSASLRSPDFMAV